ncbi:CD209 antigen-like protein C [Sardina pilchardus]|uniref:CD209 antigen-like protein C n=1 Tax=Sardina pilchardus TaxID=27697 RepID=UPI002E0E5CC1
MPNRSKPHGDTRRRGDLYIEEMASQRDLRQHCGKGYGGVYKLAGVCFGVLSILQAALNVSLRLYFHTCVVTNTSWNEDNESLMAATSYNYLTTERDQLLANFTNLMTERDQLLANFTNLMTERDQLLANFTNLMTERDQLLANFTTLMTERDNLQRNLSKLEAGSAHGWKYFSSSFYFISSERRTWKESRHNCKERSADLVVINSREEQNFVVDFGRKMGYILWMGATDHDREGFWQWVDGTLVITGYWMNNRPENGLMGEDEDCITLQPAKYNPLQTWADVSCDLKLHWICEKVAHL